MSRVTFIGGINLFQQRIQLFKMSEGAIDRRGVKGGFDLENRPQTCSTGIARDIPC